MVFLFRFGFVVVIVFLVGFREGRKIGNCRKIGIVEGKIFYL